MCSTPKSSSSRPRTIGDTQRSVLSSMNSESMNKFTAIANAAEERREIVRIQKRAERMRAEEKEHHRQEKIKQAIKDNSVLRYWFFHAELKEVFTTCFGIKNQAV